MSKMNENNKLAKWLNDELSPLEKENFQATDDYALYDKIKLYSSHLEVGDFDADKILETILKSEKSSPKSIPLYKNWFVKIAAVLVIGIGLTFVMQNYSSANQLAQNGEKTTFLLPDNSEVVLNSGSNVEYKKWGWDNNRALKLIGEAYFKVAKGKKFEVVTNIGKVTVLGTKFNVKVRGSRFNVTCFEGRVKVNYKTTELVLSPGQSVTFDNGKQFISSIESTKPAWLEHQLAFEKENLNQIIDEVQRQYKVSIILKTKRADILFTGKIPADNLDLVLKIIGTTYNLNYNKIATDYVIFQEK